MKQQHRTWRNRIRAWLQLSILLPAAVAVWALIPENIRNDDAIRAALFRTEFFGGQEAHLYNPPAEAREKLAALALSQPENAEVLRAMADLDVELLDFPAAEAHLRQYVAKSSNKDRAYGALEQYYHSRLQFDLELKAIVEHAKASAPQGSDLSLNTGAYAIYRRAVAHIRKYGLPDDPVPYYRAIVEAYPDQKQPYLDYMAAVREKDPKLAQAVLEEFRKRFPEDSVSYLRASSSLLPDAEAYQLLDRSYQPLWDMQLIRMMDSLSVSTGKKSAYLDSLKERLIRNPLDFDAVTRLFYAYHLAGNLPEAQNTLNDFRLLKDQSIREKKSSWNAEELNTMARLSRLLLNLNEEARYYYSLYELLRGSKAPGNITADEALYGLFQVLLAADQRPLQIGAGNIDYYKDIATADSNPGVLNGILSLIFNSADPAQEWNDLQPRAVGYFNRAQALRLVRITQRDYPQSPRLPAMYRDALKIYEKYGMNELIVQAGEEFFRNYPKAPEILDVGVAVADAYSRLNDHEHEWKTYDFLLPIAASMRRTNLPVVVAEEQEEYAEDEGEEGEEEEEYEYEYEYENENGGKEKGQPSIPAGHTYDSLLSRYISSLTQQKNHLAVVNLYRDQITLHPGEEKLYEDFSAFLSANQLLEDEARVYQQAIQQFQEQSWYEKLARWYLRQQRSEEFETVSKQVVDTFEGTEVAAYLQRVLPGSANPYHALYMALNQYAHFRFPYHLGFVRNLMRVYSTNPNEDWGAWEALAAQYYTLDDDIRNEYLRHLSQNGRLPARVSPTNTIEKRFAGDVLVWRSHYEEAAPVYRDLAASYPSAYALNVLLADLTRSLGAQDARNYPASAALREHLAKIQPSDSALWTTAGETMADIEDYDAARAYWRNILRIDPQNGDRYLEVATILWDYYLYDDALGTIEEARKVRNDPELFAYEAGAIQESKRNFEAAIGEYSKSLFQDSESARSRLVELYKRPKLAPVVRARLEQQLKENPQESGWWTGVIGFYSELKERDSARDLIRRASTTLNPEQFRYAASSLKNTARTLGLSDLQEELMRLEVSRAATELDRIQLTLDLARYYEAQKQDAKAETAYRDLYRAHPRSAGVINEVISYYWRAEKYPSAFAVYQEVLPAANENYRKQYLLESARRYLERKDYAPALAAGQELSAQEPLNMEYFQLIAEAFAGQQNFTALTEHYRQGLKRVTESDLAAETRKVQIAGLRRGIISANLILEDYAAALDQHIEILNRDAESESVLLEAAEFASRYSIFDRLTGYYEQTAQASPKDHRWPMVLGRLHFFAGEFDAAIADFQRAIAIRPERSDLRRQLADSYQRLGRYPDALATYEKLYTITYKDKQWLEPMAALQARLGQSNKAMDLYALTLSGDLTPMDKNFALSAKALEWDLVPEAVRFGEAAMKEFAADMSQTLDANFQGYVEALVQSGDSLKAFGVLHRTLDRIEVAQKNATFDAEELRSAAYTVRDTITRRFPELITKHLTGDQREALDAAIFAAPLNARYDWKKDLFLPMARASAMARAEEQLLKELAEHARTSTTELGTYRTYRGQLRDFYVERLAFAQCAQWLEQEWKKNPGDDLREDLPDIAESFRLAGQQDRELSMLREYYKFGARYTLQPEPVERYVSLLYKLNLQDELKQVAESADYTVANYFVKQKDRDRTLLAIDAISRKQPAVWRTIERAMTGREFREAAFNADFRTGLDLRSIGEQLQEGSDESTSLLGDEWFFYGTRYGEHLWWTGQKEEAARFLPSDLEGAPTSDQSQAALGDFYMEQKEYQKALDHFTFAYQLDPQPEYLSSRAEALFLLGRKDQALAAWKEVISSPKAPRFVLLVESAHRHDALETFRPDVESFLQKRIEQSGTYGLDSLIPMYVQSMPQATVQPLAARWLETAANSRELGLLLLQIPNLDPSTRVQIYRSVAKSLKSTFMAAAGDETYYSRKRWVSWIQRFSDEMLETGNLSVAEEVLRETLEQVEEEDGLTLNLCRALIRTNQKEEALRALQEYIRNYKTSTTPRFSQDDGGSRVNEDRYRVAYRLLDEEGMKGESLKTQEKMYEELIASGRTEDANYSGLAAVKLKQNMPEEAKRTLRRMIYGSSENLYGFHIAAELMEEHKRLPDAIEYRQELAKRWTTDMKNLAALSQDLLATGNDAAAAKQAFRVLQSALSTVGDRVKAAQVYGKAATDLVGPAEMQEIERMVRGGAAVEALAGTYNSALREVALEKMESPSAELLLAQKYNDTGNKDLDIRLFDAFRRTDRCDLAMRILDPSGTASGSEYEASGENEYGEDYYNYSGYYNPIEKLSLADQRTRELALQMADCAAKTGDDSSRLYFLSMALSYTTAPDEKKTLAAQLDQARAKLQETQEAEARRFKVTENLGRES